MFLCIHLKQVCCCSLLHQSDIPLQSVVRIVLNNSVGVALQLCSGGSVTELVKARLQHGHRMDESVIAHILKETMKVKTNHIVYRFIINICISVIIIIR